jgi:hypothetical protein
VAYRRCRRRDPYILCPQQPDEDNIYHYYSPRSTPAIVLAQSVGAFCDGAGFAAIRLRTNTIWPLIILHMLHDLLLKFTRLPAIPLGVVQVTILMIYGFYILRTTKPAPTLSANL